MWLPGIDCQAGPGESAADQAQPVLDLLQLALDDADQAVQVGGDEAGYGPLEQRPDALGRIRSSAYAGSRYTRGQAAFSSAKVASSCLVLEADESALVARALLYKATPWRYVQDARRGVTLTVLDAPISR
jgi:hypothetical protein